MTRGNTRHLREQLARRQDVPYVRAVHRHTQTATIGEVDEVVSQGPGKIRVSSV